MTVSLFTCVLAEAGFSRPRMAPSSAGQLKWVRTDQASNERLQIQPPIPFEMLNGPSTANTLLVNTSDLLQTIIGFGGALTESSASVFEKLTPVAQEDFMDAYFGDEGQRYTLARTHIGSCDFALEYYSYHDMKDDFSMSTFNMSHDFERLIPFIRRAKAKVDESWVAAANNKSQFRLVASPWSPPRWLKVCQQYWCLGACGLRNEEPGAPYRTAYARYLSKYLTTMASVGIKPWAITPQNEPQACKPTMESTTFTKESERDFIGQQLGPMLRQEHPDVKLLAYDHNKDNVARWADTILGDATAATYTDGVAFHWYSSHDYFDHLEAVHTSHPDALLLATEATEGRDLGHYLANQSWAKGEHYAHVILGDLNHWAVGWIDWNIVLDRDGGPTHPGPKECEGLVKCGDDAMVIVNTTYGDVTTRSTFYPQIFFWYMGHFSRYIAPGSRRVRLDNPLDATGNGGDAKGKADGSLEAIATLSADGTQVVVVAMNRNDHSIDFALKDAASGRAASLSINAHAIHTYWFAL